MREYLTKCLVDVEALVITYTYELYVVESGPYKYTVLKKYLVDH